LCCFVGKYLVYLYMFLFFFVE